MLLMLGGCTSSLMNYEPRVHVVQPGETLYGIAWSYRLDHRNLARWNQLENPDFIRVGQRLRLYPVSSSATASNRTSSSTQSGSRRASGNASPRPTASTPAASRPVPRAAPPAPALPPPTWRWPTAGPVLTTFGSSAGIATGISIGGRAGQVVQAAAAGRIVYAGSGLIGYGQLVIIRHNDTYLSAYGHNQRLLVEQGQAVERGQTIAEMGLGPQRQPRLHFEIRRNGAPVDPLQYVSTSR
jgi:lipoprotein NlpD